MATLSHCLSQYCCCLAGLYTIVPLALSLAPMTVVSQGGNALDIAMNFLATIFLLEIDDYAYGQIFADTKLAVKSKVAACQQRKTELQFSNAVHFLLIFVGIMVAVRHA